MRAVSRTPIGAVTANLGHAMPVTASDPAHLERWFSNLTNLRVALLFLQEVPASDTWIRVLASLGWDVHLGAGPVFRCRSAVAVHQGLGPSRTEALPTSEYHGTYLAASAVDLSTVDRKLQVTEC